jgi:hypothetical protein
MVDVYWLEDLNLKQSSLSSSKSFSISLMPLYSITSIDRSKSAFIHKNSVFLVELLFFMEIHLLRLNGSVDLLPCRFSKLLGYWRDLFGDIHIRLTFVWADFGEKNPNYKAEDEFNGEANPSDSSKGFTRWNLNITLKNNLSVRKQNLIPHVIANVNLKTPENLGTRKELSK